MALRLGDTTARDLGRLTLNPIPHIDPIGSVLVPLMSLAASGSIFIAWAKPVPVNPNNFAHVRRDDMIVSAVGPVSNVVLSFVCTMVFIGLLKVGDLVPDDGGGLRSSLQFLMKMFYGGITLNAMLALFNMIPIPPLDGSHVLGALLPPELSRRYRQVGFFGIFALLILMRWAPFAVFFYSLIDAMVYPFYQLISYVR